MNNGRPTSAEDLSSSERRFLSAMREVSFGRFEYLQIRNGEIILDPSPVAVRDVKFGTEGNADRKAQSECRLKLQAAELFEYTRDIKAGEIRTLEIRHGLPFSMEIELAVPDGGGGQQ